MKASWLVLAPLALTSCLVDSELGYDELSVSATRADGSAATLSPESGCTTLPLLLGSRVDRTIRVDSSFDVELEATRDRVRVRVSNVAIPDAFTILAEDLRSSSFARDLPVQAGGQSFTLRLRSGCRTSPATDAGSD